MLALQILDAIGRLTGFLASVALPLLFAAPGLLLARRRPARPEYVGHHRAPRNRRTT